MSHRTKAITVGFNTRSVVSDACRRQNPRRKVLAVKPTFRL
jgi:hypothetical protein